MVSLNLAFQFILLQGYSVLAEYFFFKRKIRIWNKLHSG